jgi:phospholipase C
MESPQWKRGALFVIYDEWGGFFDHVAPPRVPDVRESADLSKDFGQMGLRIPAVMVSPYARRGHVDHSIYAFESILKMIRYRFDIPPLTLRDLYANNIAAAFDFESKPNLTPPELPSPAHVKAAACSGSSPVSSPLARGARAGVRDAHPAHAGNGRYRDTGPAPTRPKPHDLSKLITSGYLERLGFKYQPATPARMYRHPSKLGLRT